MSAVMEATAIIKAKDETGQVFTNIAKKMQTLMRLERLMQQGEKAAAYEKRFAAASAGADKLAHSIANATKMQNLMGAGEAIAAVERRFAAATAHADSLARSVEKAAAAERTLASGNGLSRLTSQLDRASVAGKKLDATLAHTETRTSHMSAHLGLLGMLTGGSLEHAGIKMIENAAHTEQLKFRVRELSRNDATEAPFADNLTSEIAAKYPGITKEHALDTYLELRANAGSEDPSKGIDQEKARKNLEIAAKAQHAALALGFELTPVDMQNLLKGVEGSGRAEDPKSVEKISDAYLRAKQVFGTAIASSMIRDYVANAKAANFSVGDDQFYLTNMVRMSEGNASRLGNETNQTLATIVGGHMTKQAAKWMAEYGLITPDQIVDGKGGKFYIKGDVKDSATLETNKQEWSAHTLRKSIQDHGDLSDEKVRARMDLLRKQELKKHPDAQIDDRYLRFRAEEGLIVKSLQKTGWRGSVVDDLAHSIGNERLIERDTNQLNNSSGLGAGARIQENPVATFEELVRSISNFGTVLASPGVKDAAGLMDSMAHGIANVTATLTEFQKANPALAKVLSDAAIGGTVVGGGALLYGAFDGLMNGFGLKGSAVALDHSAVALTAAAERLGVAGSLPGTAGKLAGPVAETAVAGTAAWRLGRATGTLMRGGLRLAGLLGYGILANEALDWIDPKGNLGGLTAPIDKWVKDHFGIDPSHVDVEDTLRKLHHMGPKRGHPSAPPDPTPPSDESWSDWWSKPQRGHTVAGDAHADAVRRREVEQMLAEFETRQHGRYMSARGDEDHGHHDRQTDDLSRTISQAIAGTATISVKVDASPNLIATVTSAVKREMSAFSVDGVGSTGRGHTDIVGHQ